MRNNVNNNGIINGGYTGNNQNVIPIPFYNPDMQSVQLTSSPFMSPQSYITAPQQMNYQSIYNPLPNYYSVGVMNYSPQTSAVPYGQLLMHQNGYPSPMAPGLNMVDPSTGSHMNISQPTAPITPKRRATLQIIDPDTKSEIDVTKMGSSCREESSKINFAKDFKFDFKIEKEYQEEKSVRESMNEETVIIELSATNEQEQSIKSLEIKEPVAVENIAEQMEVDTVEVEETIIQQASPEENIEEQVVESISANDKLEDIDLQNILHEIKQEDEDDFTEVVSKKKKSKQSKVVVPEPKVLEKLKVTNNKKENGKNNSRKDNRDSSGNKKENDDKPKHFAEPKELPRRFESVQKVSKSILPESSALSKNETEKREVLNNDKFPRNNVQDHRNGRHNVQRNDSRNPPQRFDSCNSSMQRNGSRNSSVQRNGSRNPSMQRSDNQDQQFQSRNSSIQRHESRMNGNDNRNRYIPRNDSQHGSVSRNSSMQREPSRQGNGPYRGNHFNDNRNNQSFYNNEHRSRNVNRNESRYAPRNGPFVRNENKEHFTVDHIKRGERVTEVPQATNPDNAKNSITDIVTEITPDCPNVMKTPLKSPWSIQRAFRKSSSPFYIEKNVDSNSNQINTLPVKNTTYNIAQLNNPMSQLSTDPVENVLRNDNVVSHEETSNIETEPGPAMKIPVDIVSEPELNVENAEQEPEVILEFASQEQEAEVEISHITEEAIQETELKPESSEESEVKIETPDKESEMVEIPTETNVEETPEVLLVEETESLMDSQDSDDENDGRLTYYRDDLLALRGEQSLPTHLFSDPSFIDVIFMKVQMIDFVKKREFFIKPSYGKSDNLDFTRRHHHIRPKRLVRGENGYLPPQLRKATQDEMVILKRNIKSILNKMTPENFDICTNDIVHLEIDKEENMRCLIDEIFSKAIQEENYSKTYAKFCQHMSTVRVGNESFKSLLLRCCQTMFEKPLHSQLSDVRNEWQKKADDAKNDKMKKLYESEIEEQVKKAKDKYFGNIRFFSELFLTKQLSSRIILMCVDKLLYFEKDSNSLEAACKLVQVCGMELERLEKERASEDKRFSKIMNQFVALSNKMDLEPRLRFKMKDVVDMRQRNWELRGIQRAMTIAPKTLDEIKEERNKEEMEKAKMNYTQQHTNNGLNNRYRPQQHQQQPIRPVMDTKKLQMNTQNVSKETILGPEIRTQWGTGCKSNTANGWSNVQSNKLIFTTQGVSDKQQTVKVQNKYAQLEEDEVDFSSPTNGDNDEAVSDEIFDQIMKRISPVARWREIYNPIAIVEKWFDIMFNRKTECRMLLGDYFHNIIANGSLTFDQLLEGAAPTMECVDDLINDVPMFWSWLPEFLERFVTSDRSNVAFIFDLLKTVDDSKNVGKCLNLVKELSSARIGGEVVEKLFAQQ